MIEVARFKLTVASYAKCSRELARGEVKRCMQRGPLVGYYVGCPACGFIATYLDDAVGYVEDPPEFLKYPKQLVSLRNPPSCYSCKHVIDVVTEVVIPNLPETFLVARTKAA